ncbi:histidine kinase [Actinophytocola sp. KF-1]
MARTRVETKGVPHGLAYPWWIPVLSAVGQIAAACTGAAQRDLVAPLQPAALAVLLVVVPHVVQFVRMEWVPWWLLALCGLTAVAWLMAAHTVTPGPADALTGVLAILVAHVTVTSGPGPGLAVTAVSLVLLVVDGGFSGVVVIGLVEVVFGAVVGSMLRWQMRALAAERAARAGERDRATLAERQRIAREIHDLVGHSLSVTLLHVTGARRALREDGDVEDAIAALTDAERIGRDAMADIRRTVGVLATGREDTRPLPTAADVDDLVADLRAAGLAVDYEVRGAVDALPRSVGLGIYRVVQESLANVAKHAPSARARVRLDVGCGRARVRISNRLAGRASGTGGTGGTGVAGMTSRAEQLGGTLRAGPAQGRWEVEMVVPTGPRGG